MILLASLFVALQDGPRLVLEPFADEAGLPAFRGSYRVFEDRELGAGRELTLDLVVLGSVGDEPSPDPVFVIGGGPGQAITEHASGWIRSPWRQRRDIVFVDQRGTAGDHRLDCPVAAADAHPQAWLDGGFDLAHFEACLVELRGRADLRLYSTATAADDLDEVRSALGYDTINLVGGSYGTRASLVFMRRHPDSVRTATLRGVAPLAFTNPLYHARSAQRALDLVFDLCAADPDCAAAFPSVEADFARVVNALAAEPARVVVESASTGEPLELVLTEPAFVEGLRVMLYSTASARRVPTLIDAARRGDFRELTLAVYRQNRGLRNMLAFGMLLCVTCTEDVDRIADGDIPAATDGTFLGDRRVRAQKAICATWPRSDLPEGFADPVRVPVPTLVISGELDGVTPPRWGAVAARNLPRSKHVVCRRAHDLAGPAFDAVIGRFLDAGTVAGLHVSELVELDYPPFTAPDER